MSGGTHPKKRNMKVYISKTSEIFRYLSENQGFYDTEVDLVSGMVQKIKKVQQDWEEVVQYLYKIEGIYKGRQDASIIQTQISQLEIPKCLVGEAPNGQRRNEKDTEVDSSSALQQPPKKKASRSTTSRKKAKSSGPRKKKSTSQTSFSQTESSSSAKEG